MFDADRARVEDTRRRFERHLTDRSPGLERAAREYLLALNQLVDAFNEGPGADPRLVRMDTTGELRRMEDEVHWAEEERRRVRRSLAEVF